MELVGVLLLNGSMVQDAASPTLGQRLLRSAVGPLFSRLSSERFFRQQFGSIFSPGHPLTDEEAEDQWALICAGGGRTLTHKTIRYMEERFRHAERWHGALRDWPKPALARLGHARSGCDRAGSRRRVRAAARSAADALRGPRPLSADRGSRAASPNALQGALAA